MKQRVGRLLYDSARAGAKAHARSGLAGDRMLVYRSGPLSIDMVVHSGPGEFKVFHGQVIREDVNAPVPKARVRVGRDAAEVSTDDHGQFAFSGILRDTEDILSVTTKETEVICTIPETAEYGETL